MKNSQPVTAYLDYCEEQFQLQHSEVIADLELAIERIPDGVALWQACLDAGWTLTEIDAAFERRFGRKVPR